MRAFVTSAQSEQIAAADQEMDSSLPPITTTIDGYPVTLHALPTGTIAMAMFAVNAGQMSDTVAVAIDSFFAMLRKPEDVRHFKRRLFDRSDPFEIDTVLEVIREAFAEWAGNPTQSASDSSPSQPTAGTSSTGSEQTGDSPRPSAFGGIASST